jgi:hypothetical protein
MTNKTQKQKFSSTSLELDVYEKIDDNIQIFGKINKYVLLTNKRIIFHTQNKKHIFSRKTDLFESIYYDDF